MDFLTPIAGGVLPFWTFVILDISMPPPRPHPGRRPWEKPLGKATERLQTQILELGWCRGPVTNVHYLALLLPAPFHILAFLLEWGCPGIAELTFCPSTSI